MNEPTLMHEKPVVRRVVGRRNLENTTAVVEEKRSHFPLKIKDERSIPVVATCVLGTSCVHQAKRLARGNGSNNIGLLLLLICCCC
jgi:hypothetical protein